MKGPTMEYFVTMTTHVPEGTPEQAVDDVRGREAAHSGELATQGHLLRLWRPPLQPGEWRSVGLFAADDDGQLEEVLASMPLRVWRTDEVTALSPHPNDPAQTALGGTAEFLTTFTISIPDRTSGQAVEDTEAREAGRAKELAEQGHLERLWVLPGHGRALGLWQAQDVAQMETIVKSLPLDTWMTTHITPLTPHPNDPVVTGSGAETTRRSP
jgi:muconolactone delta-isomerase